MCSFKEYVHSKPFQEFLSEEEISQTRDLLLQARQKEAAQQQESATQIKDEVYAPSTHNEQLRALRRDLSSSSVSQYVGCFYRECFSFV